MLQQPLLFVLCGALKRVERCLVVQELILRALFTRPALRWADIAVTLKPVQSFQMKASGAP